MATTANWLSNYCVSQVFLNATATEMGEVLTFAGIAFACAIAWLFVYFLLPETKGNTIE